MEVRSVLGDHRVRSTCTLGWSAAVLGFGIAGLQWTPGLDPAAAAGALSSEVQQQTVRLPALDRGRAGEGFDELAGRLQATERRLARVERAARGASEGNRAIEAAWGSVALVLIGYGLYHQDTGVSWRLASAAGNGNPGTAAPDGLADDERALPSSYYAASTGFLIAGNRIVTNRHVAEPWWRNQAAQAAIAAGFVPRYTALRAYFPGLARRIDLKVAATSAEADIAILEAGTPVERPPLRLGPSDPRVRSGDRVVVVSYPLGFDAILARADEGVARHIRDRFGDEEPALARALADRQMVRPLAAVGHVADVLPDRLVYDAATTYGSSGGPVLNAAGEVVAVNYGGMDDFAGVRFGVPVNFLHRLLGSSGSLPR
jgi:S1-C subfamily serine protease